jgi:hypothetical protein
MRELDPKRIATVPIRCPACGAQTHKTLESIIASRAFICGCGVRTELDLEEFTRAISRSAADLDDFGNDG